MPRLESFGAHVWAAQNDIGRLTISAGYCKAVSPHAPDFLFPDWRAAT